MSHVRASEIKLFFSVFQFLADRCNATFGCCHNMSSVCLSVTRVCCDKTAAVRIMHSLPAKFGYKMRMGPLDLGLEVGWGDFRLRDAVSRKRCEIELRWQLITNSKSYMGFRLQQKLMTLNDLERQFTALSSVLCVL